MQEPDFPFTDEQWCRMCDVGLSRPVPLHEADLEEGFVYQRQYGIFYVPMGWHIQARALLLAFHHGHLHAGEYAHELGLTGYHQTEELAERFLTELPGTAFVSSVGSSVIVGRREHLDARERQAFRGMRITYLEDDE